MVIVRSVFFLISRGSRRRNNPGEDLPRHSRHDGGCAENFHRRYVVVRSATKPSWLVVFGRECGQIQGGMVIARNVTSPITQGSDLRTSATDLRVMREHREAKTDTVRPWRMIIVSGGARRVPKSSMESERPWGCCGVRAGPGSRGLSMASHHTQPSATTMLNTRMQCAPPSYAATKRPENSTVSVSFVRHGISGGSASKPVLAPMG